MAEKDTIFKGKLAEEGIFNFKDFYSFAYDWLNGEGYNLIEKKYSEKIVGDAKEIEIIWESKKKISDYFVFFIKMDWKIVGMKNVKVKREGKEVSMNSGIIEIRFKAILVKDYENRWEDHPFWKFLRGLYDKYIIRSRIDDYEDKLKEEIEELLAQSKAFLVLEGKK